MLFSDSGSENDNQEEFAKIFIIQTKNPLPLNCESPLKTPHPQLPVAIGRRTGK